jgi:hypothetical protein
MRRLCLCKHLCAVRVRARTPPFYFSLCSFNINPPIEPTCRVPKFIVSASLLQTPCLGSVKLSFCLNPIAAFKFAARPFCSESVPLCPTVDCSMKDVEKKYNRVESSADKLYNAVIDNSNPYDNMEKCNIPIFFFYLINKFECYAKIISHNGKITNFQYKTIPLKYFSLYKIPTTMPNMAFKQIYPTV